MTGCSRRAAGAAPWVVGVGVAAFVLHGTGGGALTPPAITEPGQWSDWLEARGPVVAAFGLLRLLTIGVIWYLVIATLVGAALRMIGAASLVRVTDRLTIGPVRRMLAGSVSLGLAASGLVTVAAPALRASAVAQTSTTAPSAGPPATVTMHRLGPAQIQPPLAGAPRPEVTIPTTAATERWTVKPGECFWSIAESVLTDHRGRAPTDAEIVPFWTRLIDTNRDRLVHGDNPDLIFPGQVFTVPPP